MKFESGTQLPISALGPLAKLKERYQCGPLVSLDEAQRAMLEAFDELYPAEKLCVVHAALNAGRSCISGAQLFALAPKPAAIEEHAA